MENLEAVLNWERTPTCCRFLESTRTHLSRLQSPAFLNLRQLLVRRPVDHLFTFFWAAIPLLSALPALRKLEIDLNSRNWHVPELYDLSAPRPEKQRLHVTEISISGANISSAEVKSLVEMSPALEKPSITWSLCGEDDGQIVSLTSLDQAFRNLKTTSLEELSLSYTCAVSSRHRRCDPQQSLQYLDGFPKLKKLELGMAFIFSINNMLTRPSIRGTPSSGNMDDSMHLTRLLSPSLEKLHIQRYPNENAVTLYTNLKAVLEKIAKGGHPCLRFIVVENRTRLRMRLTTNPADGPELFPRESDFRLDWMADLVNLGAGFGIEFTWLGTSVYSRNDPWSIETPNAPLEYLEGSGDGE